MRQFDKDAVRMMAIAQGDKRAFDSIYRECWPKMTNYATGRLGGDRAAAEDALQEAMLATWLSAGSYAATGSAVGWVRAIVRNKIHDLQRKSWRTVVNSELVEAKLADACDRSPLPDEAFEIREAADCLGAAIARLPADQRKVIQHYYFEYAAISEIARIELCPANTVKTRLHYARAALGNCIPLH